ncbi:MAG: carbohydrate kinase family protein [Ignavibacteriales bacterium]
MNSSTGLVTCMGEILIDMVQETTGRELFEAHPGGAPANVAVGIARLGGKSAFMGKVGDDRLGKFLVETLKKNDVNIEGLKLGGRTGIALVSLAEDGERSFDFYEKLITYGELDVDTQVLDHSEIFHFGSISLIDKPQSLATIKCLKASKERKILISYDPNYRPNLWKSENIAREGMRVGLKYADVLKVAKDEIEFLTSESDVERGIKKLYEENPDLKLIAVTLGAQGSYCWYQEKGKLIPTIKVSAVDTTGAGDGFMAGLLYSIQKKCGLENMDWNSMEQAFKFANIVGSITTTQKGAISALPYMEQIKQYI